MIEPFYFPSLEICTVQGKKVLALYVHSGEERPYQARISIPERKEGMKTSKEKAVYIRRGSSTVVASREEIRELYDLASRPPLTKETTLMVRLPTSAAKR